MGRLAGIFASASLCIALLALSGDGPLPRGATVPFPRVGEDELIWRELAAYAGVARPMPAITVYQGRLDFIQAAVGYVPQAAAYAVGFYLDGQVHLLDQGDPEANRRVLRHELVHGLLDGGGRVPRWFNEGLAGYLEEQHRPVPPDWLARRFLSLGVSLDEEGWRDPARLRRLYAGARLAVRYLAETRGEGSLRQVVRALARGEDFAEAFRRVYGVDPAALQAEMRRAVQ